MKSSCIRQLLTVVGTCISVTFLMTPAQGSSIVIGGTWTDIGTITFVSPKPGDTPAMAGTALLNTINGITDNSATNPYLIKLGPGIYDIGTSSLQMKQYVDIEGSGENTTKITGSVTYSFFPPANGTINGASNAELRFLTVENTGVGGFTVALFNSSASPSILHVTARALGGTQDNYGVYNTSSSPVMTNVTADGLGGAASHGIRNVSSSPVMTNVTASGSGGGLMNWGVYSSSSGTVKIAHSVIKGTSGTIGNETGVTTWVANTQLDGGPVYNSGTLTCAGVYDENYTFYASTCP